jgi:hypothetical protein
MKGTNGNRYWNAIDSVAKMISSVMSSRHGSGVFLVIGFFTLSMFADHQTPRQSAKLNHPLELSAGTLS